MEGCTITQIPDDCLTCILAFADVESIGRLEQVSKYISQVTVKNTTCLHSPSKKYTPRMILDKYKNVVITDNCPVFANAEHLCRWKNRNLKCISIRDLHPSNVPAFIKCIDPSNFEKIEIGIFGMCVMKILPNSLTIGWCDPPNAETVCMIIETMKRIDSSRITKLVSLGGLGGSVTSIIHVLKNVGELEIARDTYTLIPGQITKLKCDIRYGSAIYPNVTELYITESANITARPGVISHKLYYDQIMGRFPHIKKVIIAGTAHYLYESIYRSYLGKPVSLEFVD